MSAALRCIFCDKPSDAVEFMFADAAENICSECVDRCADALSGLRAIKVDASLGAWPGVLRGPSELPTKEAHSRNLQQAIARLPTKSDWLHGLILFFAGLAMGIVFQGAA